MPQEDCSPELDAYITRAHRTRGEIIDHTILLERIMDEFIALNFSDNKNRMRELMDMIISEGMNYRYKVKIVLKIINKRIPDEKQRVQRLGSIRSDLEKIAATRNKFAHEVMRFDVPIETLNKFNIILFNYHQDKNVGYTENDIIEAIELILKYVSILEDLRKDFFESDSLMNPNNS
jgi:hypothetical protein